jgi:SPW repeat
MKLPAMKLPAVSLPRQWEDWLCLLLGFWLCLSPWVLPVAGEDTVATPNAVLVGALLIVTEIVTLAAFRAWEEWINAAIGAWLIVSPWALGIVAPLMMANFVIVGAFVLVLALYELWDISQHPHPA